ncbi:MAG: AraC family transcriptional regulator [Acidobacteria bacterium]|nr:MAG: AraC family transcriptional regulator [Acidobacteriota bacterium]
MRRAPAESSHVNPPAETLGTCNAVLWGRGRRQYHVREFPGPLSIKSMVSGAAEWRVGRSRFDVDRDSYLVLNHAQPYSITIDAKQPVETFCVFFEKGFVEDASSSLARPAEILLDDPFTENAPSVGFFDALRPKDSSMSRLLSRMRQSLSNGAGEDRIDEIFYQLALELARLRSELPREISKLPAVRRSTREELFRRLHSGKAAMDAGLGTPLKLHEVARAACLSPFHFHRLFKTAFGETPHEYATRRRLEKAVRLLGETDEPVTEISFETGFQNPASFSTLFRSRMGMSPREFRRKKARSQKFSSAV